ncbi:MAG TPA: metallophosphoesterase family protein [Desulfopila sp.]|nr:metallophosphoesterase family protein [Desulfopila sp.]
MVRAGILSDTHLEAPTQEFCHMAARAFADCDIIFHAGDITGMAILEHFDQAAVHAVSGNMCGHRLQTALPRQKKVIIDNQVIGLCHGTGPRFNIEERLWALFPGADCIIYGHTHQPVCESKGGVLFINPGSFQCTSRHGTPASYCIMDISAKGLKAQLKHISVRT